MIHFAYDGTIHGDWVSRYAIRLAAHEDRVLRLMHVEEGQLPRPELESKLAGMRSECEIVGVTLQTESRAKSSDVAQDLANAVADRNSLLICGTRSRPRMGAFLAGTVSDRLLRNPPCRVLVFRVAHPGLLGQPLDFLLPVAGHPRGMTHGLSILKLFAPDIDRIHVLHVQQLKWWQRLLPRAGIDRLRQAGLGYTQRIERELRTELPSPRPRLDATVVVATDIWREIVTHANRLHSRLIFLGATERTLRQRLFSGQPIEQVLATANCDVAVYRGGP